MPDDDRFSRYLTPAWRKVLRSLQGHAPAERVADAVAQALAATVRTVHGVPSLPGLAERMLEAASAGNSLRRGATAGAPDSSHVPTQIAERAATVLAATMQRELALVSPDQAALMLARRVLADLAHHYGFDRMVRQLLNKEYSTTELRAVMAEVVAGEQVSRLATRFLSRPSGEGLRAPPRQFRKRPLAELLSVDLEAL
jgi:hypothetical protein